MIAVCRFAFALAGLLVAATSGPALAHPHVFVDARAEIVFDKAGEVTAIRHIWQFDEAFTAFAIQGLDADNDGKLSDAELAPLAKVNVDSLKEYGFFTWLRQGRKSFRFVPPTEYWLEFHGGRLTLFYTLPLKTPVAIHGKATLEVFDPEYFVAFTFPKKKAVTLSDAPPGCTAEYHPPQHARRDDHGQAFRDPGRPARPAAGTAGCRGGPRQPDLARLPGRDRRRVRRPVRSGDGRRRQGRWRNDGTLAAGNAAGRAVVRSGRDRKSDGGRHRRQAWRQPGSTGCSSADPARRTADADHLGERRRGRGGAAGDGGCRPSATQRRPASRVLR